MGCSSCAKRAEQARARIAARKAAEGEETAEVTTSDLPVRKSAAQLVREAQAQARPPRRRTAN